MKKKKQFNKKKSLIIWGATSTVVMGILIAATILDNTYFSTLVGVVLGTGKAITSDLEPRYAKTYDSKAAAKSHGDDVNVEINEEGITLLKKQQWSPSINIGSQDFGLWQKFSEPRTWGFRK